MSAKEKVSNPLVALVIFLCIIAIAILTTILISRAGSHLDKSQEALIAFPKNGSTVARGKTTARPQTPDVPPPTVPPRNVCESPECITLAHQLHNWADPSVDPCVNFYEYTCGKYNEHTVVEGTRSTKKGKIIQNLMREFLLRNQISSSKSENTMQMLFNACEELKDPETFKNNEESVLKKVYKDIQSFGSWPLADLKWDASKFDLNKMLQNLAKHGRGDNGLFEISTQSSPFLEVSPVFDRKKPAKSLEKVIKKILVGNNIKFDKGEVSRAVEKYKDMEKTLNEFPYEYGSEKVEFSELEAKVPSLDIRKIIDNLMNPGKMSSIKEKVENRLVAFEHSFFFDEDMNLNKIIQSTSAQDLANFLIIYYIDTSGGALSIDEDFTMHRKCENMVITFLPRASLRVFVRNYFDKENLKLVSKMVEETKQNFIEMIQESTWLHEKTKKNAILKVEKMRKMVGYPEEFEKEGALDKTFETLNVFPTDSFYTIMNKIKRFVTEQTMEYVALETPLDPKEDMMDVNAFYVSEENYLNILVPFLDDPLFDSTYPTYAKLAGTGATLGHEAGHGFDPWGITRDEKGENRDWWTPEDSKEYERRVECMVEQYNQYDDPDFGKNLNGTYTKHAMVADGFGAETAWRAFKKLDLSREPEIIGFDEYTKEKLFFRIYALDYCTSRDTETLEEALERSHPTDSFRVNGVFSNMKQFAEVFDCPVGSPMNPEKKCELF